MATPDKSKNRASLWGLAFFSGAAGLIYEVLWLREFALRLGNTAQASSLVLAAIFAGLALGNLLGGKWANRISRPLKGYALIELAMAACGGFAMAFLGKGGTMVLIPLFFLLILMAILMGATLPLLIQAIPQDPEHTGRESSWLYGINTTGGMIGAGAAGMALPLWLGIRGTFSLAIFFNLMIAILALKTGTPEAQNLEGTDEVVDKDNRHKKSHKNQTSPLPSRILFLLTGLSGAGTLALEVLWTRMFSLVFQNSVYSFSLILVLFLLSLAISAAWVASLSRRNGDPYKLLLRALSVVAFLIPLGAWIFIRSSHLKFLFRDTTAIGYILNITLFTGALVVPVMIAAGMILPLCWVIDQRKNQSTGWQMGSLLGMNTIGGVLGALAAGFILIPQLGLWPGMGLVAVGYACGSLLVLRSFLSKEKRLPGARPLSRVARPVIIGSLFVPLLLIWPSLPTQHLKSGEKLLFLEEGAGAQVAVVELPSGERKLKVNSTYNLGSSSAEIEERRMGQLPLLLHPDPKSLAFVGLATGITASAIYDHPVDQATLIELLPEVVRAASWFDRENRGIIHDPKWNLVIADGRVALPKNKTPLDLVISDLFVPWHAGTWTLYSLEYYREAARKLSEGGMYVQWLPLYQLSLREFQIIGRTFSEAFPHVSMWRGNFSPDYPILALIGSKRPLKIDLEKMESRLQTVKNSASPQDPFLATPNDMMLFYVGGTDAVQDLFKGAPLNTDNHPLIEYLAPMSHIRKEQLIGSDLAELFIQVSQNEKEWRNHALAGAHLYQATVSVKLKQYDSRTLHLEKASRLVKGSRLLTRFAKALKLNQPTSQGLPARRQ